MNDRGRAQELLAEAWQRPPTNEIERLEVLVSALVHAVLALGEGGLHSSLPTNSEEDWQVLPSRLLQPL